MKHHTLRFDTIGRINCIYTEEIDLGSLGRLEVSRATDIEFNKASQRWEVHETDTDNMLFSHPSRDECLHWEHYNLQPG